MGNLVILDYIRSSLDIILNLKIETSIIESQGKTHQQDRYINSSRGGHGASDNLSDS